MAAKTYLIVANGLWPKADIWKPVAQAASHVIACDGAAHQCLEHNLSIDTIIGDMDSISEEVRGNILLRDSAQFIPQEGQENNDLVKAIEWSVGQGAEQIEVIGIEGGDLAHQFAAIFALCEAPANTRLHTTESTIQLLDKSGYENSSIEKNTSFFTLYKNFFIFYWQCRRRNGHWSKMEFTQRNITARNARTSQPSER